MVQLRAARMVINDFRTTSNVSDLFRQLTGPHYRSVFPRLRLLWTNRLCMLIDVPSTVLKLTILSNDGIAWPSLCCKPGLQNIQMGSGFGTFYHLRLSMQHLQTLSSVRSRQLYYRIEPGFLTFENTCKYFFLSHKTSLQHTIWK